MKPAEALAAMPGDTRISVTIGAGDIERVLRWTRRASVARAYA